MFLGDTDWYGPEFLNESYRMLPLLGVIERDRDEGTDDLVVLYCYLSLGRRVGKAAERLHMHRNNVRYRIDAMRRRYGFDLDDSLVCTRLLNDHRFMTARSPEFREGLLGRLG